MPAEDQDGDELVSLIARVPADLRDAVKIEAARRRRSLQSIVVEALDAWLRQAAEEG